MGKFNFEELIERENFVDKGIGGKKLMFYGSNSSGKTYQSCHFPHPLLIMAEAGGSAMNVPKVDCTDKWSTFTDVCDDLCKNADKYLGRDASGNIDESKQILLTVIIDTAENLVALSEKAVCAEFGVRDLSEITGKQNGYLIARNNFKMQINRLTAKGYCVVFIAHEQRVERTDELTNETYTYVMPQKTDNEKSSMRMLRDLVDFCFYIKPNGVDEDFKVVPSSAICVETKTSFARSRFAIQTFIKEFTAENVIKAIEDAIEKTAEIENMKVGTVKAEEAMTVEGYIEMIKPYGSALMKTSAKDEVVNMMEQLLNGKKLTECDKNDLVPLDTLYNKLVSKAIIMGIEI